MKNIAHELIKDKNKFMKNNILTKEKVREAFEIALEKIDQNLDRFTYKFPSGKSWDNVYREVENNEWTNGFWTGMIWLSYEITNDEKYRRVAEIHVESFKERLDKEICIDHHDLGFLYSLSCVAAYKITKNEEAKNIALRAAEYLIGRYKEKGQFIQAWGDINDPEAYRFIIDCMLNIPLLYWATEVTGDKKYYEIAYNHMTTTVDGSGNANVIENGKMPTEKTA